MNVGLFELFVVALVGVLVLAFLVITVLAWVRMRRNSSELRRQGIDPMAVEAHLVGRSAGSDLERRLEELDDLHRRGRISEAERAAARARLLGG